MTDHNPSAGNAPALSDLHTKAMYLHGLMAVLNDYAPWDVRTRNGYAAVAYMAEQLADEVVTGLEAHND